jgi:hypothetical protein
LILEGDEALRGEAVAARDRIAASLPGRGMRARFEAMEAANADRRKPQGLSGVAVPRH